MFNIITIIDDTKIRSQVEGFLRELDEEGIRIRSFASAKEFYQKYFEPKPKSDVHPLAKIPGLEKYSPEALEFLLSQSTCTEPTLRHKQIKLRYHVKTKKIIAVEPPLDEKDKLWGHTEEGLKGPENLLRGLIPEPLKTRWDEFWKKVLISNTHATFPLSTEKGLAWFKISNQRLSEELMNLTLEEQTESIHSEFEKERKHRNQSAEEAEELQLLSEIHLILFKIDTLEGKVPDWLSLVWSKLKAGKFFPEGSVTRFVLLKYEDDGFSKLDVMHPHLDDLIYLPLDRLMFLQKMEILKALPGVIKPSYLFAQPADLQIEVSKLTKMERISDVGLAIRNPVALINGIMGHFYINLPDEEEPLEVFGKVIHSEVHPEREKEFLVYFSFFALTRTQHAVLRKFLMKAKRYQPFLDSDQNHFRFDPEDPSLTEEEKKPTYVAILDLDDGIVEQLKASIPRDFDLVKTTGESSLALFGAHHFQPTQGPTDIEPVPAGETELFSPAIAFAVQREGHELHSILTPPQEDQLYFGLKATEAFSEGNLWFKPFAVFADNKILFDEAIQLASAGHTLEKIVLAQDAAEKTFGLKVKFLPADSQDIVKIEITTCEAESLSKALPHFEKLPNLDLMVIDAKLLSTENINAFLEGLQSQARAAGLLSKDRRLRFILTLPADKPIDPDRYSNPAIVGLIFKPIEPRQLNFLIAAGLGSRFSLYTFANLGWLSTVLPAHVAKPAKLSALSEFGADLLHPRPIAPGTILYLRKNIFDNAPNRCLAARFYHCEPDSSNSDQFRCSMIYFGINDAFMKYARKWFRETYAQSKQGEN